MKDIVIKSDSPEKYYGCINLLKTDNQESVNSQFWRAHSPFPWYAGTGELFQLKAEN
jgi:hypothetical protein